MKAMLREVTTPEEIDVLEREWEERGNPRSTNGPKAFAAARKRIGIEQVAADEEIGVQEAIGTAAVSEQPELAKVRWTTPDGKVIEGTVHHDEDSDQIAIVRGDEYHYLDADEQVQIFTDYREPEAKPKPKPKPKAEKFGGSDLTIEEWAESYETELGERPTDKQLHEYITGKTTQSRGIGREPVPMVDEPLDVTLRDVKNARKAVKPEVTEEVVVEPEVEVETTEVVEPEPEPVAEAVPTVAGVEIPRQPNGAPSIKAMKDAAAAATTIEEIDELQRMENNAVEDGFIKAHRKSVQNKINKRKDDILKPAPEVEAKPTPAKKKRKTLTDKVEEAEEKAKPKPKKAKKKAKAPVDPAKEAKPTSTKKKKKTDARQKPDVLTKDKNGATKVNDLINVMDNAETVADREGVTAIEVVKAAWGVYIADVKHGRRKRRSPNMEKAYNRRMDELAGEEFAEAKRPVPSSKPQPKKKAKETEDQAAERMERDLVAEWPWHQGDTTVEEEYGFFAGLEGADLSNNLLDEINHRWMMTNGLSDYIDPHFVMQVVNEIAEFNPNVVAAADAIYAELLDQERVDENRQLRLFLTQEYPGALTLKDASGEPTSKIAGTPATVFSRWLELADIAEADAEERRAAALEKFGAPVVTAVQQERKAETVTEEELEAEGERLVEEADEELDEIETRGGAEEMSAQAQALRDMGLAEEIDPDAEPEAEERIEKKKYPSFGWQNRPFHVPTVEDVKRVFSLGWDVELHKDDIGRTSGFELTRKKDGMKIAIVFTDVFHEIKEEIDKKGPIHMRELIKKYRLKFPKGEGATPDMVARAIANRHTHVLKIAEGEERLFGRKKTPEALGTYRYDTFNGMHIITLDREMSDNITLWHESLHMWLRALATDEEMETVFGVFDTEEEFTGFMGMFLQDEAQAMRMAEEAGASKKDAGTLKSIAKRMLKMAKDLANVLGYNAAKDQDRAANLADLHNIAQRILYGEAYLAPERRNRYMADATRVGLARNKDGSIRRIGQDIAPFQPGPTPDLTEDAKKAAGQDLRRLEGLLGIDPQEVEFADNERRNENANAELPAQIPDEPRVKEQDGHTRPGGAEADNVPIVLKKKYDRKVKNLKRWIKQNMTPSRGVDPALRKLAIQAQRLADKGKWRGLAAHNRMKKIAKDLRKEYGEDRVNQSLAMVLDGRMSLGQFKRIFNLADDSPAVESLQEVMDYQDEVQDLLFSNDSIPQELRKRILANARYQTRFYAVHVLGSGWITPDEHYITAVDAIVEEFDGAIQRSLDKATTAAGSRIQFDFGEYMYATQERKRQMTADLTDTRRAMVERAARDLYRWVAAVENIRLEGGRVQADWTADSIRAVAEETVDGYLDNAVLKGKKAPGPIGGMPITNMMHRKLDKVFRDLYGEVQDPGSRLARTMEVQSTLLATATMFQKMFEEGEGKWWSEGRQGDFAKRLSENEHGGDLTPGDRRKYGSMAGKWVTQEAYDLIHQSGTFTREMDTGIKAYAQWVQGVTRGTRLLWWKTAMRNFLTSITGFAFGSGDALEKGWGKHLKDGTVLATRIADALITGKDPQALEILADLVEKDIFDVRQETQLAEVQANLDRLTAQGIKGRALKPLKIAMQAYGLIDLPAKYASYHVRIDKGDTHAQAVEHLHKFYQYRDSVPEFVTKLNRLGLGDYFGYTYDSGRIMINQMKHMVTEANKGNIRPLLGLTARLSIPAFRYGTGTAFKIAAPVATAKIAAGGIANVLEMLGMKEDDEDDEKFRVATAEQITALRHSLPSYDRDQPLAVWYELQDDGTWTIKWQVLGNLSAFPLEDVILGAWQSASQDPDRNFGQTLLNNVANASPLSIGMMPENVYKLFTGNESIVAPQFKEPGLLDVRSDYARARRTGTPIMSNWDDIIGNRLFDFFGDSFVPGQTFRMLDKLLEVKYGKDPMLGRAIDTPEYSDVSDIMFRLIRKYDRDKDTQGRVLKQMISGELKGYENEKWLAGEAGREELRTQQGPNKGELLDSERARENWHTMLKAIEGKVDMFRTLTKGNFTDVEINAMLKDTPLRSGEREHIINGTVTEMKANEFEFDHKPRATQRGDELVIEYFNDNFNDNKTVNYKDIHTMLEESGYIPGKYGPGFRRRVKDLRKDWNRQGK
jgi:hypothetical protein